MSYEEKERKFSLKWIIILLIVVIAMALLLFFNKKDSNAIIKCTKSQEDNNGILYNTVNVYRENKGYEIVLDYKGIYNNPKHITEEKKKEYVEYFKDFFQEKFKKIEGNYTLSFDIHDDYIKAKIVLSINKESEKEYASLFGFNILDASNDDIINYLEKGGVSCESL